MCGIYMFDITILSIREIKMTKSFARDIQRIQVAWIIRIFQYQAQRYPNIGVRPEFGIAFAKPGSDTVRYAKWCTSIALRFRRNPRDGKRCRLYFYFTYIPHASPLFARARGLSALKSYRLPSLAA